MSTDIADKKQPSNVCIFGLSANPPTGMLGHQGIVKLLIDLGKFDEIWILPVYTHMYSSKQSLAGFDHRMEMCKHAFIKLSVFPTCRVVVKPTERTVCERRLSANPNNKTGTAEILDFLTTVYPQTKFSLALGADSYLDLVGGKWNRQHIIAKHIENRFEIVARAVEEQEGEDALEDMIDAQNAKANTLKEEGKEAAAFGATLHHLPPCQIDVSSTIVRAQLVELEVERSGVLDKDSPLRNEYFIDPDVLSYCRSKSLFLPRKDEEGSEEASQRLDKMRNSGGIWSGWGIWLIVIPTVLIIALSFMGVSYSTHRGLILPPMLGGEPFAPLLTIDNVEEVTAGKTVLVKFMAPWCGHCKKLKPTWDSLASSVNFQAEGAGHVLVADVDCTSGGGRPLCEQYGVQGFPTIKVGDIVNGDLEEYEGSRTLSDFKQLVLDLSPPCTPATKHQCSSKDLQKLEGFLTMPKEELEAEISKYENMKKKASEDFEKGVNDLKAAHKELMILKQDTLMAIRENGLNNARAVLVAKNKER